MNCVHVWCNKWSSRIDYVRLLICLIISVITDYQTKTNPQKVLFSITLISLQWSGFVAAKLDLYHNCCLLCVCYSSSSLYMPTTSSYLRQSHIMVSSNWTLIMASNCWKDQTLYFTQIPFSGGICHLSFIPDEPNFTNVIQSSLSVEWSLAEHLTCIMRVLGLSERQPEGEPIH